MILTGDCLEKLAVLGDNSVDSVVTDPPYGLKFMGKKWDYDVPSVEMWREVLRVLKPGGHLLSFGGTRTYHRMVVAIEDAGFEVRDQIMWLYGSGFPKSHSVDKAIDRMHGAEREVVGVSPNDRPKSQVKGGKAFDRALDDGQEHAILSITAPATEDAVKWQGWGTALKPANEPIVLARKPLIGTVAENVLKYGTGGLNIDASRIEAADQAVLDAAVKRMTGNAAVGWKNTSTEGVKPNAAQGRWPANIILDECAAEMLDEQSIAGGMHSAGKARAAKRECEPTGHIIYKHAGDGHRLGDTGGASRFFYVAKASKRERNHGCEGLEERDLIDFKGKRLECLTCGKRTMIGSTFACGCAEPDPQWVDETKQIRKANQNHHPTVKPIKLMEYLINLVTPPGGTVLDPFAGSGSTLVAAKGLGFQFIGIEMNEEYVEIANKRIEAV